MRRATPLIVVAILGLSVLSMLSADEKSPEGQILRTDKLYKDRDERNLQRDDEKKDDRREKQVAREERATEPHRPALVDQEITVYFSPPGGATAALVDLVRNARRSVDMQAFTFTNDPIADALIEADRRGIKVRLILDKSERPFPETSAKRLKDGGIALFIDEQHRVAHNKVMIIDGEVLVTGSFNFTIAAEEANAENLLIIRDRPKLVDAYRKNFEEHQQHSVKF